MRNKAMLCEANEYFKKHYLSDYTILVGWKQKKSAELCNRADYYYNTIEDVEFGDSGYHALQLADRVFRFKNIYLAGYDYSTKEKTYHFDESESDTRKMEKFIRHSIGKVRKQYETMHINNNVYNCNPDSKINRFNFKLPY